MADEPEIPDWYAAWARDYLATFGGSADLAAAIVRWHRLFAAMGFARREVEAATVEVARSAKVPQWPADHLGAVKSAVARLRWASADSPGRGAPDWTRSRCTYCDEMGWVRVPYPADVRGGEWKPERTTSGGPVFRIGCVTCRCAAGLRTQAAEQTRGREPLSLARYESTVNPAWREHLAEREAAERVVRDVERMTPGPPGSLLRNIGRPF